MWWIGGFGNAGLYQRCITWFKHTVQILGKKTKHLWLGLRHLQRHLHLPRCSWTKISASVEPFFSLELFTQRGGCPRGCQPHPALLWIFCFYKYVQINYRHFEMSLVGINQRCKVMDSQSVKETQAGLSRQWFRCWEERGGFYASDRATFSEQNSVLLCLSLLGLPLMTA